MEKTHYTPPEFANQANIINGDLIRAFCNEPQLDLTSKEKIAESLEHFTAKISASGEINQIISPFIRNDIDLLSHGNFVVKSTKGRGYATSYIDDFAFYADGDHSIVLGYQKSDANRPIYFGVTSFRVGPAVREYNPDLKGTGNFPVVLQIQGPNLERSYLYDSKLTQKRKHNEAKRLMIKLGWDQAMIELVAQWVYQENIRQFFVAPSEMITWEQNDKVLRSRFHIRYDVGPQKFGFKKTKHGLWYFQFDPQPTIAFQHNSIVQSPAA